MPLSFNNLHDDDKFFSDIVTPAKAPKKRARSETTTASPAAAAKKAKGSANKENGSAPQAAVEADGILASGRPWSVADKTKLFTWLLGAEGDEFFEIYKKDPARIHKKVSWMYIFIISYYTKLSYRLQSSYLVIRSQ
jgi:hypothetical protein